MDAITWLPVPMYHSGADSRAGAGAGCPIPKSSRSRSKLEPKGPAVVASSVGQCRNRVCSAAEFRTWARSVNCLEHRPPCFRYGVDSHSLHVQVRARAGRCPAMLMASRGMDEPDIARNYPPIDSQSSNEKVKSCIRALHAMRLLLMILSLPKSAPSRAPRDRLYFTLD